ncbi:MAG: DNA-binding response regulator [Crocinitomicaceae bacterium]
MMRILIVEDELLVADHLRRILTKRGYQVVGLADDIQSATNSLEMKPDLCMVDIRLANNDSGITIGEQLNAKGIPFIYITANNEVETIRKAAITRPSAYLTKPFNENDIAAAIELVKVRNSDKQTITIHTSKGKAEIPMSDILYCQADNVYSIIVTEEKSYTERITLKELEQLLSSDFEKVHRSYIVNKHWIDSKTSSKIFIAEHEIPVSRSFRK